MSEYSVSEASAAPTWKSERNYSWMDFCRILLHIFRTCLCKHINIVKFFFQKIESELGIDFIFTPSKDKMFLILLKLWSDKAQLALHLTEHTPARA